MHRIPVIRLTLALAILAIAAGFQAPAGATENHEPIPLTNDWLYHWGDSPVDTSGTFSWLSGDPEAGWKLLPGVDWPPDRNGAEWVWYRTKLPAVSGGLPVLYLPNVAVSFEVYIGENLIYHFGQMQPDKSAKYAVANVHVIPLPADYHDKVLSLRVFSNVFVIGFDGTTDPAVIGPEDSVVRRVLLRGFESTAIGFLLIFAGLFGLLTYLVRLRENLFAPLSFAAFSICLGIFQVMSHPGSQFIISSSTLKLYMITVPFMIFPVGMYAYLQYTIFRTSSAKARGIIWGVFSLHLGFAVVLVALDLFGVVVIPIGMRIYNILFLFTVPVALVVTLAHAMRGSIEARIAMWGFAVFGFTGVLDLLQGLGMIAIGHWLSSWGALVFVGSLGYVLERQFTESHRRLKDYSAQLQEKSEQLEEYSRTLEDKVSERTRTLDEKNRQLEDTLKELKETQHQLIMQEKMASLGGLVAGVAHEVNNPIGAVVSASDVSARCVDVVRGFLQENGGNDDPKVKKASDLLAENNAVISEAAHRVSQIVKSLKNFARLDESDFQEADIHDGIESTLTLVRHLLKGRIEVNKQYGDVPKLLVYPNQLNQVYMNLIVNAIDAIEDKGTISIATHADSMNAYVNIVDDGKGISPDNLRRIFDPGFTTKGVGVGTGLGLSISYKIIQRHGGALDVESTPGKGTKFTIVLPLRHVARTDDSHQV